jgi:aspartokinase
LLNTNEKFGFIIMGCLIMNCSTQMQVLHPQSMRPAREGDIPVRVKNSYNPKAPGTLITKQREMDKVCIILLKVYSAIVTSSVWH